MMSVASLVQSVSRYFPVKETRSFLCIKIINIGEKKTAIINSYFFLFFFFLRGSTHTFVKLVKHMPNNSNMIMMY